MLFLYFNDQPILFLFKIVELKKSVYIPIRVHLIFYRNIVLNIYIKNQLKQIPLIRV